MKNYKMVIAYDGRRYDGYAQKKADKDKSVQGKLEMILEKLYGEFVEVIGAVSTYAGVHAKKQVVNFEALNNSLDGKGLFDYFEKYLPDDIIVYSIEEVDSRFHSRYLLKSMTYEYRLWKVDAPNRPLFERQYVNVMVQKLDVSKMKKAAKDFIGEHDFTPYTTNNKVKKPLKTVFSVDVSETRHEIIIRIEADAFLMNMERFIIGTLVQVGLGQLPLDTVVKSFKTKKAEDVGHKAMAGALCLVDLSY